MAAEATMILMGTSAWMCHNESSQFLAQAEAIELYCKEKIDFHPENCVGILAMGGFAHKLLQPTRDLPRIMSRIYGTRVNSDSDMRILEALDTADYVLENIMLDKKRIVVFVGGPACWLRDSLRGFGMKLKEKGVAVDVVNFGKENGPKIDGLQASLWSTGEYKKESLEALVAAANKNDNSRILHVPQDEISLRDHLSGSPILSWSRQEQSQSIIARQKAQIDALTKENDAFTQENDALTQDNEKLKRELEFFRTEFMKCFHKVQAHGAMSY